MNQLIQNSRAARRLPPPAIAKLIRVQAHISQEELAQELQVHRVTLGRWEAGTSAPRGKARAHYARLLDALQQDLAS